MPRSISNGRNRTRLRISLRVWLGVYRSVFAMARGPIDLIIRVTLAQAFVVTDVMSMASGHGFGDGMSASAAFAGVSVVGLLFSLGLFTRLSAGTLLAFAVSQQFGLEASEPNLFISALLGWFVLRGPGALSIDRAVAVGLRASALPLSRPVMRGLDALRDHVAPVWLLLARLWLAAALLGSAGDSLWLPSGTFAPLPLWARLPVALLLVTGLGLPVLLSVLTVVFAGVQAMHPMAQLDLYVLLFLTLMGMHKGGALTIDGRIGDWLHGHVLFDRPRDAVPADWPHVVIIGAGFGGLACAAGLRALPVRITVIDRHNYHLFQPLLYQVATGGLSPADVATPIRGLFQRDHNVAVRLGTVTGVDRAAKVIKLGDTTLAYDYCVLATGAQHSYFGRDDWAPFAPGLKRIEDGVMARSKVLTAFERAETMTDPEERRRLLTFVIIGAGPTGVELAGAIAELARAGLSDHYRTIDAGQARIVLVQSGDRVLPSFPEALSVEAKASLERLGVEVLLGARVTGIDEAGVAMGDARIETATVLWAAGVVASPAADWLGATSDRAGRVVVADDLSVPGCDDIFVIGDTAASMGWNKGPVPGLAPAAKQGGAYVARVIRARLEGAVAPPPFAYRHMGSLATIGRKAAVADFGFVRISGALAWWLWGVIHVAFLVGVRNRLAVILNWIWCYLSFRVSVQLITGELVSHSVEADSNST